MTIRKSMRCDNSECRTEGPFGYGDSPPHSFFILKRGVQTRHYCSTGCLAKHVHGLEPYEKRAA